MSNSLLNAVWKTPLPPTRKLVAIALADLARKSASSRECYVCISTLIERCGLSERAIQKCLIDLEKLLYLTREFRKGQSTRYHFTDPDTWATPAPRAPLPAHHVHPYPRTTCTPVPGSPPSQVRQPPHHVHPTPAPRAPITYIQPLNNHKEEKIVLPDWLPDDTWKDYCEYRKVRKSGFTKKAQLLAIAKLTQLRESGNSPIEVINQTILNGWTGLFPVKNNAVFNHSTKSNKGDPFNDQDIRQRPGESLADWSARQHDFFENRDRHEETETNIINIDQYTETTMGKDDIYLRLSMV